MTESGEHSLSVSLRRQLMETAVRSIRQGLESRTPFHPDPADYPEALQASRSCFVTIHHRGELRGCMGHLEAVQSLILDVADNAFAAAFRDPRFGPLTPEELDDLEIHISVLTAPVPLPCTSENDLISELRYGVDGLILEEGHHRGTFLPSVWNSLPDPADFLRHLKVKAGLSPGHWSEKIRFFRYETESFGQKDI